MRHHVVITGVGRSGTTFLVELLTELGLDTGFDREDIQRAMNKVCHAGLEHTRLHLDTEAPYFVKSPLLIDSMRRILDCPEVVLDHVLVPMRRAQDAARSRIRMHHLNQETGKKLGGGLQWTKNPAKQHAALERKLYQLMVRLSTAHVPVTLIHFPTMVENADYLYEKMKPVLGQVQAEEFRRAHKAVARTDLVHDYSDKDGSDPAG